MLVRGFGLRTIVRRVPVYAPYASTRSSFSILPLSMRTNQLVNAQASLSLRSFSDANPKRQAVTISAPDSKVHENSGQAHNVSTDSNVKSSEPEPKPTTIVGRVKLFVKQYGIVGVGIYGTVYVTTLGLIYVAVSKGYLNTADLKNLLQKLPLLKEHLLDGETVNPKTGDFLLAWLMTKVTEPLRMMLTMVLLRPIARALGKAPPKVKKGKKKAAANAEDVEADNTTTK